MFSSSKIKELATSLSFQDFFTSYTLNFSRLLQSIPLEDVYVLHQLILNTSRDGHKIFLIGNGGSASLATHIATGLNYITNTWHSPIRALSLCADSTAITSLSNDLGFENVFTKQLEIFWQPGDLLIGLSTSGKSKNITNAFSYINSKQGVTCSIVGGNGGELKTLSHACVHIKTEDVVHGPVEDTMQIIGHIICYYTEHNSQKV
jgi:D-sedoheptulose 7-phosphate isomerase